MKRIVPYVNFQGKCREAMNFYRDCLGGDLTLMTAGESPVCDQMPPDSENLILHSALEINGSAIMGTDMGKDDLGSGPIAITLEFTDEEETRAAFKKLAEGGTVVHELHEAFWGGLFGVLGDKYGICWMINSSKDQPSH